MISLPEFIFKDVEDPYIRENFKRLNLFLQDFPLFRGEWKFFEFDLLAGVETTISHGLDFKPTDVIQTALISDALTIAYFDHAKFTDEVFVVTSTEACTVRCFIGAYKEESSRSGR
jgi:hypothetical protein